MQVVAVDIGGTHARFALAEVANGRVQSLADPVTLKTAEYASFQTAWEAFGAQVGPLPRAAAIAVASPVGGELIKLTNNPWVIRPALIKERLSVDDFVLINDFGAVGHAVAQVGADLFEPIAGPDLPLPDRGIITVCGPGTGLGVAQVLRTEGGYHVLETEGGHTDFAPLDSIEDAVLKRLRADHGRVSAERVVSGPGIVGIYRTLADIEKRDDPRIDDKTIWTMALEGSDSLALAALDRFCLSLGAVAGDLALAQGAKGVVIAGGLGLRLKDHLARSGFAERFAAKGRFRSMMEAIPVKLITHPQPGLFGAAAAFAQEFTR
ncbi:MULTISPECIES: glucokinase [Sphingomonas]|uniref:glucokinase n=1 Tax=Sphingomonas TaxID=13687 RepID=UPI0008331909|nr:glucokinase [Sphingomonas sp. CCH10-B3]